VLFDWKKWLVKKEVGSHAEYFFMPSIKKWPGEVTDIVRKIYDPHYLFPDKLRADRAEFDSPRNFIADPIGNAPLLDCRQEVYFSGTVYPDAISGALYELGMAFCLWNPYVLILSEAKDMWREGFINHVRVIYLNWLAKQFEIPKINLERFPEQRHLNPLFHDFIDGQQKVRIFNEWRRKSNRSTDGFWNSVLEVQWPESVDKSYQEFWKPGYAFAVLRNGPFIDMFSRPVLTAKED
jgi:hypothetical protein